MCPTPDVGILVLHRQQLVVRSRTVRESRTRLLRSWRFEAQLQESSPEANSDRLAPDPLRCTPRYLPPDPQSGDRFRQKGLHEPCERLHPLPHPADFERGSSLSGELVGLA